MTQENIPENTPKKTDWIAILTIIGGLITVAGFAFGLYAYYNPLNADKKDLIVRPTIQSPIIRDEITNGLEFTVNGIKTNNVYLNEVELVNSGTVPISKDDFYDSQPAIIDFGDKCEIVSASVDAKPDGFKRRISFSSKGGEVKIEPTLINPGDSAILKVVTANCEPSFTALVDIEGISEISKNWTIEEYKRPVWLAVLLVTSLVAWLTFGTTILNKRSSLNENVKTLIVLFGAVIIFSSFNFFDKVPKAVSQIPEICRDIYNKATSGFP